MTLKDLEKHALSVPQCDRLIEEASRGESQFREDADALERLRLRLGFSAADAPDGDSGHGRHRSPAAWTTLPEERCRRRRQPRCLLSNHVASNDGI